MQLFLFGLYILIIVVLQTVVFARLNVFGVSPDLILVSVILFSVFNSGRKSIVFAAVSGFAQDVLSFGAYLNTITKVAAVALIEFVKESFIGNDFLLALILVLVFTPLVFAAESLILLIFQAKALDAISLFSDAAISTLYNLVLVPVLFPIIRKISHD